MLSLSAFARSKAATLVASTGRPEGLPLPLPLLLLLPSPALPVGGCWEGTADAAVVATFEYPADSDTSLLVATAG